MSHGVGADRDTNSDAKRSLLADAILARHSLFALGLLEGGSLPCAVQFVAIAQAGAQAGVSKDLMDKAQDVMIRMLNKLEGKDFRTDRSAALSTSDQVAKLISRATSNELLCQSYIGWCPFW
jgi:phosphatidylinositol kinase/protein kinase (PI-3  family)